MDEKRFLNRAGRKSTYFLVLAALAVVAAAGFLMLPDSRTVSAQEADTKTDSRAETTDVATQDMINFALNLHTASEYTVYAERGVSQKGSSIKGEIGDARRDAAGRKATKELSNSIDAIRQLPCNEVKSSDLGRSFTPGVYCLDSAELAGEMVLTGGNAASTYIFRVAGSLNAKSGSSIRLENGAQAGNVYFVADEATVAGDSTFRANILTTKKADIAGTVTGKVLSLGEVSMDMAHVAGGGTGTMEICKEQDWNGQIADNDLSNQIYHFTVTGAVNQGTAANPVKVAVGSCSAPFDVTAGSQTVTELAVGTLISPTPAWKTSELTNVRNLTPGSTSSLGLVNLATQEANVNIVEGGTSTQLTLEFTNRRTIIGYIEICKMAARGPLDGRTLWNPPADPSPFGGGDPDVTGYFQFTVHGVFTTNTLNPTERVLQVFSIPVGQCTPPIRVTLGAPAPAGTPRESRTWVSEIGRPGFYVESVDVTPSTRQNSSLIFGAVVDAYGILAPSPGGGTVNVDVVESATSANETLVVFHNRSNPGMIKVCKIAGPGIPLNTLFRFTVTSNFGATLAAPPQLNIYGPVQRTFDVRAGDPAQGGQCVLVPGLGNSGNNPNTWDEFQTFINGTPVFIYELGVSPLNTIPIPNMPRPAEVQAGDKGSVHEVIASADQPGVIVQPIVNKSLADKKAKMMADIRSRTETTAATDDQQHPSAPAAANAIRTNSGCTANTLAANDDGSTGALALPSTINWFGTPRAQTWVNNNGNITFDAANGTFVPGTVDTGGAMAAVHWSDVDTNGAGSGLARYGNTTVNVVGAGTRPAFCATWDGVGVGYFSNNVDKLNKYQVLVIDRSDVGPGDFDLEYNYNTVLWDSGDVNGTNGFCDGTSDAPARFGFSGGTVATTFELPGSGTCNASLDSNLITGLTNRSYNSQVAGRYIFPFRNGVPAAADQQIRTSRITTSGTFVPGAFGPAGNPDITPGIDALTYGIYTSRAAVFARAGVTEVTFVNYLFRPTRLKVCKVAGPGVAVGAVYNFTVQTVSPVSQPGNVPLFPGNLTSNVSVQAGNGPEGSCSFATGPFPGGTFNQASTVVVTETAGNPTSITSSSAPAGCFVGNTAAKTGTFLSPGSGTCAANAPGGLVAGINAVTFVNNSVIDFVPRAAKLDYDGDKKADPSVFTPSTAKWTWAASSEAGMNKANNFGVASDKLVPADYDGDGKTDLAVYRASTGYWYFLGTTGVFEAHQWGQAGDIPQAGDYDGDGKADFVVYRPGDGTWYEKRSRDGFNFVQFGQQNDKPYAADYDGDGMTDIGVYRVDTWYTLGSTKGFRATQFGAAGDIPVPADYDGDGAADLAVYRAGTWYVLTATTFSSYQYGLATDIPVPDDYDGDGKTDLAVYRASEGKWYVSKTGGSANATPDSFTLGGNGDVPVPAGN